MHEKWYMTLLLALGYLLGAQFGFQFALTEHSPITLIWPPSGIALGALLCRGRIALPGIFIGAVSVNVLLSIQSYSPVALAAGIVISAASTISAFVGAKLLTRFAPSAPIWNSPADILIGSLLTGIACTISATFGVASLYVSGQLPLEAVGITLGMWWLGDSCGMVIFAPFAYVISQRIFTPGPFWRRLNPEVIARSTALNAMVTLAALFGFLALWDLEGKAITQSLQREAAVSANLLSRALQSAERDVISMQALISASEEDLVEREFHQFTNALFDNKSNDPGTHGVLWAPRITNPKDWGLHMMSLNGSQFQLFELEASGRKIPVRNREDYFPLRYIYSQHHISKAAVGFDLGSELSLRTKIEHARDTGKVKMIAPLHLALSQVVDEPAMQICLPVYQRGHIPEEVPETVEGRRARFRGITCGVYLMGTVFDKALANTTPDIDFYLFENSSAVGHDWFYTRYSNLQARDKGQPAPVLENLMKGYLGAADIRFAEREWLLLATPGKAYVQTMRSWTPWAMLLLVLVLGVVGSSILIDRVSAQRMVINERKKTKGALHEARAANEAKSYFMAAASHDIKQPLYALGILTDTLLMTNPPDTVKPLMKRLKKSIKEMSLHFDTLMDVGRFQDGSFKVNRAPFQLSELSRRISLEIEPLCIEKGLRWKIEFDDVQVHSDAELLLRLIRNLMINAVRYTEAGEVACTAKRKGSIVELAISDTGPGLSKADQELVFREVVQLGDNAFHTSIHGLGLSIVNRISQSLDLQLEIITGKGQGSKFVFQIPLAVAS